MPADNVSLIVITQIENDFQIQNITMTSFDERLHYVIGRVDNGTVFATNNANVNCLNGSWTPCAQQPITSNFALATQ